MNIISMHAASTSTPASPLALSEDDVERLLHDNSSTTRIDLTDRIAGAYGKQQLSIQETIIAEQIFRLLIRDTEVRVRVSLAENVKSSLIIPRDIVMSLARDVEEVALPVLESSEVLNDQDLVELINMKEEVSRHLAISKRKTVSATVSDTLLDKGNDKVATVLADNKGATLSDAGVEKMIEMHGKNTAVMQALTDRPGLPVNAVNKLVTVVSGSLAETLKKKYRLSASQIEQEVEKTREKETLELIRHANSREAIVKIIGQLRVYSRLTPSIIFGALCQGNVEFFETSLAVLADVSYENAHTLIYDKGELGFRAIYNKARLPDAMFPAINTLLRIVQGMHEEGIEPGAPQFANGVVERILERSKEEDTENLSYIIALVRRTAQ